MWNKIDFTYEQYNYVSKTLSLVSLLLLWF